MEPAGRWTASRGWSRPTKGTPNQALHLTGGARRLSVTCSSLVPRRQVSLVVRHEGGDRKSLAFKPMWALLAFVAVASAGPRGEASAVFDRYVQWGHECGPAVADLSSGDALIQHKRASPDGEVRGPTLPAKQYNALIRQAVPRAKARGDTNAYAEVPFTAAGSGGRMRAVRFSTLKQ